MRDHSRSRSLSSGRVHSPNDVEAFSVGQILAGKYRLESLIGQGGMGVVYAAHHELLHQRVAIKLLLADASADDGTVTRFLNEARAAAKIPSEHVVRVLDVGLLEEGRPFLVMEYLEGHDLARVLRDRGRLTPREAVDYVLEAIEAVSQAHALGIVHRDLKPSNLFLTELADGTRAIKVLDFGIAKAFGDAAGANAAVTTQGLLGSPGYMAPEYVRSAKAFEPRSDMWALGVVLYELLSGTLPFRGDNVGEILVAILEKKPAPLAVIAPDLPPGLGSVVERCLRRKPQDRFADLAELAEALAPFATKRSQSIARIRTTMRMLEERPATSTAAVSRRAHADDPTELAPGVQTNDSWSGAAPTVRRPRRSRVRLLVAILAGMVVAAAIMVGVLVLHDSGANLGAASAEPSPSTSPSTAASTTPSPSIEALPSPSIAAPVALPSASPRRPTAPKPPPRVATPPSPPAPTLTRDRL